MRKLFLFSTMGILAGSTGSPLAAQPSLHITIPLPPPILFPAPPSVVILPETQVYAVPDIREDIFFHSGWWWRPWNGRWYRSLHYDRGWAHYGGVPSWYRGIPHTWREDYHNHRWGSGVWNHRPIHHDELQRNWRGWQGSRHWDQPQYRQHEVHRDGRPYPSPVTGRRTETIRHDAPRPHEDRRDRESRRPVEHPPQGRPPHDPGRGRPGGPDRDPEPRRERH